MSNDPAGFPQRLRLLLAAVLLGLVASFAALVPSPAGAEDVEDLTLEGECAPDDTVTIRITNTGNVELFGLVILTIYADGPVVPDFADPLAPGESVELGPIDVVGPGGETGGVSFEVPFSESAPAAELGPFLPGCGTPPVDETCDGQPATIVGTDAGETIVGTSGPDVIVALGGNDVVRARGGDDVICLDGGDDRAFGGSGQDRILGGPGFDNASGGPGNDTLFGGEGWDRLAGNRGDDSAFGEDGLDRLIGGPGEDSLDGGAQLDLCIGGGGTDVAVDCEIALSIP